MTILRSIRSLAGRILRRAHRGVSPVSTGYEVLAAPPAREEEGWLSPAVAERQHAAFRPLLEAAARGEPRIDFDVAARAIAATGLDRPSVVEVGCGSGYYGRVLPQLLGRPIDYTGLDYSRSMVTMARTLFPAEAFVCGDARSLPFGDASYDVVLSGTSLMHIVEWERAIAESARVARGWVIVHSVPVLDHRPTTLLRKNAYGEPVLEVILNRGELEACLARHGLVIHQVYDGIQYDLSQTLGERSYSLTYLCRKAA